MKWLVPLPVALPLLVAAGLVAAAPICRRRIADTVAILTALVVTVDCGWLMRRSAENTLVYWFSDWLPRGPLAIGISFAIDPIGAALGGFCACLVTVALIYCWEYFDAVRTYFHALMLIFLAAMVGFCFTGDLFNLFVFFELMSVLAYALTGYKVEEKQALAGAMNFAVTNSIGGFAVLIGIALLYGRTGALNMAQVGETLAQHPADRLVTVALMLLVAGFFVKAAVVPFHFWLADAHAVALFASIVTGGAVLRVAGMVFLGLGGAGTKEQRSPTADQEQPETRKGHGKIPLVMLSTAVVLALVPLVSALEGGVLTRSIGTAAHRFTDVPTYARAVMQGQPSGPGQPASPVPTSAEGLVFGFAAAGGAGVLALLSLYAERLPRAARRLSGLAFRPVLRVLRQVHSGHTGDQILWLVVGLVAIGIGLLVAVPR